MKQPLNNIGRLLATHHLTDGETFAKATGIHKQNLRQWWGRKMQPKNITKLSKALGVSELALVRYAMADHILNELDTYALGDETTRASLYLCPMPQDSGEGRDASSASDGDGGGTPLS